jgi:hypothetical protein
MNNFCRTRQIALVSAIAGALLMCGTFKARHREAMIAPPASFAVIDTPAAAEVPPAPPLPPPPVVSPNTILADDADAAVRKAATEWIKAKFPSSKVEGVFTLPLGRGNLYIAGADTSAGESRRTIDLLVRLYTRRNGSQYWRAESLSGDEAANLMAHVRMRPAY